MPTAASASAARLRPAGVPVADDQSVCVTRQGVPIRTRRGVPIRNPPGRTDADGAPRAHKLRVLYDSRHDRTQHKLEPGEYCPGPRCARDEVEARACPRPPATSKTADLSLHKHHGRRQLLGYYRAGHGTLTERDLSPYPQVASCYSQSIRRRKATATAASATEATMTIQKPAFSWPASAGPASLMPNSPPRAAIPASTTVTPVSRFMITDRLLLIVER